MSMFVADKYVCIGKNAVVQKSCAGRIVHNILSGTIGYSTNGNEYYSGITVVDRYLQLLLL